MQGIGTRPRLPATHLLLQLPLQHVHVLLVVLGQDGVLVLGLLVLTGAPCQRLLQLLHLYQAKVAFVSSAVMFVAVVVLLIKTTMMSKTGFSAILMLIYFAVVVGVATYLGVVLRHRLLDRALGEHRAALHRVQLRLEGVHLLVERVVLGVGAHNRLLGALPGLPRHKKLHVQVIEVLLQPHVILRSSRTF